MNLNGNLRKCAFFLPDKLQKSARHGQTGIFSKSKACLFPGQGKLRNLPAKNSFLVVKRRKRNRVWTCRRIVQF